LVRNRAFMGSKKFGRDAEFKGAGALFKPRRVDGSEGGFADWKIAGLGQSKKVAHSCAEIGFMADEQHRGFGGEWLELRDQSLGRHSAGQPIGDDRIDTDFFTDDLGGLASADERAAQENLGFNPVLFAEFSDTPGLLVAFGSEFALEITLRKILGFRVTKKVDDHPGAGFFYMLIPPSTARTWPEI